MLTKLSVIMPVYNAGDSLEKSVSSIDKQTMDDVELICIDDGSTDNSLEELNRLADKYDFVKVFSQENQGSGKARNKGINEAKGEYIGFLDADDFIIDEDALKRVYDVAKANDADMAAGNIMLVDDNGNFSPFSDLDYYKKDGVIRPEKYGIPWAFYKIIYKRDFLSRNNIAFPDLIRGQDPVFLANALSKADKIYTVSTDLYAYHYVDGANQCNTSKKRQDHIRHFREVFDYLKDPKFKKSRKQYMAKIFVFIDMIGIDGAVDILDTVREVFADDEELVRKCERHYLKKFPTNYMILSDLDLVEKPKISVVVPVYNAEPFLEDALNSVLNQTFRDFEVLCVNDGSSDYTFRLLNEFASRDSRIKIINKPNGGCGSARNMGLEYARGDYIYFFDPDDYILPDAFERLYENAANNDSDMVMFKIARFRDGEPVDYSVPGFDFDNVFRDADFKSFTFDYRDIKKYVLNSSFAPWSKLYKKEFLDRFDDFRFDLGVAFDDVPFHVKSLVRASRISFVPEFFYHYRLSNPNSVNNTKSNQIDIFRICDLVEEFLVEEEVFDEFREEFIKFKIAQISNYAVSCNYEPYYMKAMEEFSKMDISNLKMPEYLRERYEMLLESDSYNDYRREYGAEPVESVLENKDEIKVSVIIPVYNTAEYLEECLDSVANQTLRETEIICVNDGSTDNSLNVLEEYAKRDSRIKIISQPNQGQGAARNRALDIAQGKYVYFMDSDDFIDLGTLKTTYDVCEEKSLDFAMFQLINYDDATREFYDEEYYNMEKLSNRVGGKVFSHEDISELMFSLAVSPCNRLFNREFLEKANARFPEGLKFEDNVFYYRVFLQAKRIYFIERHMYKRRRRQNSTTGLSNSQHIDVLEISDMVFDLFRDFGLFDEFECGLYNYKISNVFLWFRKIKREYRDEFYYRIKENFRPLEENSQLYQKYYSVSSYENRILLENIMNSTTPEEFDELEEKSRWKLNRAVAKSAKILNRLKRFA